MEKRFKTKSGRLTSYAFACGYIEKKEVNGIQTTIWRDGGCSHYNIRRHDFNNHKRIFWEDSRTISQAYKIFNRK